jgi:hypothetical protein
MSEFTISRREALQLSLLSGVGLFPLTPPTSEAAAVTPLTLGDPSDDWAIVVGIDNYPNLGGLGGLRGPRNDATEFWQWLTAPIGIGGGVPPPNAKLIVQPCGAGAPCPTGATVTEVFEKFRTISETNATAGRGTRVGRRLYLYFAGHGIEPIGGPALLMADAALNLKVRHIPAHVYAEWFRKAAWFDEVFLFMDCCRDNTWTTPMASLIFDPEYTSPTHNPMRYFYGYATKWSRQSRERAFAGTFHGIFTQTLLEGLRGAASDPATQLITAGSLQRYIYESIGDFGGAALANLSPEEYEPQFERQPEGNEGIVIAKVQPKLYTVWLNVPAAAGKILQVISSGSGRFTSYFNNRVAAPRFKLELARGVYMALYPDGESLRQCLFQVPAETTGKDVSF